MRHKAFELLHGMEQSWWYRGRATVVGALLKNALSQKAERALDFGAGFGGMCVTLGAHADKLEAFEPHRNAAEIAAHRGYVRVYTDEKEALVEPFDLIGAFDVMEHIEDDMAFAKNLYSALVPGGEAILTVPAFPFLWSSHDEDHHHYRRYTKRLLRQRLKEAGFEVVRLTYWNCLLFLPATALRLMGRSGEAGLEDKGFVGRLLFLMIALEAKWLQRFPLPFGLSLVVVVRKPSL